MTTDPTVPPKASKQRGNGGGDVATSPSGADLFYQSTKQKAEVPRYPAPVDEPILVYLGDLYHNYMGEGEFLAPMGIACLAAYARAQLGPRVEIKLFKKPLSLMEAVEKRPPHVIGLSNFMWNEQLGLKLLRKFKSLHPEMLTLMGGANMDMNVYSIESYLKQYPFLDLYVMLQGEIGFTEALYQFVRSGFSPREMKKAPIVGCDFYDFERERLVSGPRPHFPELDAIPSPYLAGLLDEFLDAGYTPFIETNRGCPYECTFCAWGNASSRRVDKFDLARVKAEIEYIAQRCQGKPTSVLFIGDANFGIFPERDIEIAEFIHDMQLKYGYPKKLVACWTKNKGYRVLAIQEALQDVTTSIVLSFQSLNEAVLKNIKRSNMKAFKDFQGHFIKERLPSRAEMILGLPGETKESYLQAIATLMNDLSCSILSNNCRMFKGAEMNQKSYRERFGIQTGWRILDNCYGKYGDVIAIEIDEVVTATQTMSWEDILYFRPFIWLMQFVQGSGQNLRLLSLLKAQKAPIIEFFKDLAESYRLAHPKVRKQFEEFHAEARCEFAASPEELLRRYQGEENWQRRIESGYGKMNSKYTSKVTVECKKEFDDYLALIAKRSIQHRPNARILEKVIGEIMRFESISFIDLLAPDPCQSFSADFHFDVCAWEENGFEENVEKYCSDARYVFYVSAEKKPLIEYKLKFFAGLPPALKLSKIEEGFDLKEEDLRYRVTRAEHDAVDRQPAKKL